MKSTMILSIVYLLLSLFLLNSSFNKNFEFQLFAKIFLPLTLLMMYVTSVKKEKRRILYIIMIFFIAVGELAFLYPKDYFIVSIYAFCIAHIIFTFIIYRNYLRNKSKFDVFTFSLPFMFTISVIFVLLDLDVFWSVHLVIAGLATIVNASTVLLNYANKRNEQNYLFFMGVFIWMLLNSLAVVYVFKESKEIYYLLSVILDVIAHYMICRAFILDDKGTELNYEDF